MYFMYVLYSMSHIFNFYLQMKGKKTLTLCGTHYMQS